MPAYQVGEMHRLICAKLEAVERGACRRLMIFTPPRHGKSELVSKRFPAWFIGKNPQKQIISASYGARLSARFGRHVRNIVASKEFGNVFPDVTLSPDSKAKDEWNTNAGGVYLAVGVDGGATGSGADIFNIDDPVKDRAEAESQTFRDNVWDWYTSTAYTREMPGGAIILTMTRWHEDDLAGRLLAAAETGGDQWDVLCLPALCETVGDPLGRNIGEALWPDRYDAEALTRIRAVVGTRDFGALYQQDPQPPGGSFFSLDDVLVNGEPIDTPILVEAVFAIIDTATKTGSKHDGTAVSFWAYTQGADVPLVCLDWDVAQIEGALLETWLPTVFQRLEDLAKQTRARMGSIGAYIEDKASGMVLLQQAARRSWPATPIDSPLTAVGKDERAISVSGYVRGGMVKMSRHAYDKTTDYKGRHANHFIKQVFRFMIGVKDQEDDALDTFTYAIAISLGNSQGF